MGWSEAASGAAMGAGAGSAAGPWGTLVGGLGGGLVGLFSGGGDTPAKGYGYIPGSEAFNPAIGDPSEYFGAGGTGGWYMGQANDTLDQFNPYVDQNVPGLAMQGPLGVSARENQSMDWFSQMANGQDSIAQRQAAIQQDQLSRETMSQAATASQGRYNPALQRQAMIQQSQLGQQMAGQTALAAMQEKQQAQQAYAQLAQTQQARLAQENSAYNQALTGAYNAQSGRQGMNIGAYNAQTGRMGAMDSIKQGWMSQALAQAERDRTAKIAREKMLQESSAGKSLSEFYKQAENQHLVEYRDRLMHGTDSENDPSRRNPGKPMDYDEYRRDAWDKGDKSPW